MNTRQLSRFLGWFSLGLGVAELLAPRKLGRAIGVREHHGILPLLGLREIASGVGLLTQPQPTGWLWSRVAGDLMDLGLLGAAARSSRFDRGRWEAAVAAVTMVTILDLVCSVQSGREQAREDSGTSGVRDLATSTVRTSVTIGRPPEELYSFWRNFENLPRFMNHLETVEVADSTRSRWVAKGPLGSRVEWHAEITSDRPGKLIAWRSLTGSTVDTEGSVEFSNATGNRGTVVRVNLSYRPPGGIVGATIAKLLGEAPEKQVPVDLLRFKQLLETGEIARTEGQSAGRPRSTSRKYDDFVRV